ncbi:uncharacterized protein ATNIH1004_003493 [Aspergillus tanneri]|uniref:Uncharacterized protein n=1 Tax=Aspergillus tanneri TaxID=1220188 RepID=A0A5M9MZQ5_9EURO|nr:uncharacterized protein ATNIH1004_003493 [Aspergillus tanneri]KAA8650804.1 hypothetical protein ATNIH1004_003493 [Aspergillus tanneri]
MAKWYTEADSVMSDHRKCTIAYGLETAKPETKYDQHSHLRRWSSRPTGTLVSDRTLQRRVLKNVDKNMLLYLQITDHQALSKKAILNYSSNFVSSGMDRTICI